MTKRRHRRDGADQNPVRLHLPDDLSANLIAIDPGLRHCQPGERRPSASLEKRFQNRQLELRALQRVLQHHQTDVAEKRVPQFARALEAGRPKAFDVITRSRERLGSASDGCANLRHDREAPIIFEETDAEAGRWLRLERRDAQRDGHRIRVVPTRDDREHGVKIRDRTGHRPDLSDQ